MSDNLYHPPESHPPNAPEAGRRWAHVLVAFLSAMFIPGALAYCALAVSSPDVHAVMPPDAIATLIFGAFISAAAVYRHKRIALWAAALVGVLVVLSLAVAPSIWNLLVGGNEA